MLKLVTTLIKGINARHEDRVTDHFAIDLIEQKVRDADTVLRNAKETLASLILRERNERRLYDAVSARKADLETRAKLALADGNHVLASEAAVAIADLENEAALRSETLARLKERIARMQLSLEKTHRRIVDLKQGLMAARAVDGERKAQASMNRMIGRTEPLREAEELVARVMSRDDPMEESEVLDTIDKSLTHETMRERLAASGYGQPVKVSAADVLKRLRMPTAGA
jgi:phage shock protein A